VSLLSVTNTDVQMKKFKNMQEKGKKVLIFFPFIIMNTFQVCNLIGNLSRKMSDFFITLYYETTQGLLNCTER